jgi:hypothetical protein
MDEAVGKAMHLGTTLLDDGSLWDSQDLKERMASATGGPWDRRTELFLAAVALLRIVEPEILNPDRYGVRFCRGLKHKIHCIIQRLTDTDRPGPTATHRAADTFFARQVREALVRLLWEASFKAG